MQTTVAPWTDDRLPPHRGYGEERDGERPRPEGRWRDRHAERAQSRSDEPGSEKAERDEDEHPEVAGCWIDE